MWPYIPWPAVANDALLCAVILDHDTGWGWVRLKTMLDVSTTIAATVQYRDGRRTDAPRAVLMALYCRHRNHGSVHHFVSAPWRAGPNAMVVL